MIETSELPEIFFSSDDIDQRQNRLFKLQAGESIRIRSHIDENNYLYLHKGEVRIETSARPLTLTKSENNAPKGYMVPQGNTLIDVLAITDAVIYQVDSKQLDDIVAWVEVTQSLESEPEKLGILSSLLTIKSLAHLTIESIYELVSRMEIKGFKKGEEVIIQGDEAEHFYVIYQGSAKVWAMDLYDDEPKHVNSLQEGDSFGEDALVTGGTRNATVRMTSDGILLIGNKKDFKELIAAPCIDEIDVEKTNLMKNNDDYELLDVRYEEEWEESYIEGCILIPLHELRIRLDELDQNKKYIIYCRSGNRSAVAALILKKKKYNAVSMAGGIKAWPYETRSAY
ncbi:MAG: cyclic nucleotide-binding domain-containing protein [Gammaproteobacteria bacterium]|nr:cyclic nucleotide-binding domain-containing protein [Gammaproteobacteria bacterium]